MDSAVTSGKLADCSVTSAKIQDCTIVAADLADCAVTSARLADTAVTTGKINDAAVTYAKMQSVTAARLLGRHDGAAGVVQEITLAGGLTFDSTTGTISSDTTISFTLTDSQVDSSALADSSVSTAGIQDGAVTSIKIADGTIVSGDIADCAVTSGKLGDTAVITAKINNTAVTYAKIQDVTAQRLLGREDGVAGSPQEIALSAELRFDTTNDWLEISDSGVLTGLIADSAVTTAKINNGAVTLAKMDSAVTGRLITFDSSTGAATTVGAGTSGQVLTSNGAGNVPTFQAASSTPVTKCATIYETTGRFSNVTTGSATITYGTTGLDLDIAAAAIGSAENLWNVIGGSGGLIFKGSPLVTNTAFVRTAATAGTYWCGLGNLTVASTGITFTGAHAGFKIIYGAAGAKDLYATNADGTTETATNLVTITTDDVVDLIMKINGTTSIDYYYRVNGGALSSATNHTTNLPAVSTADNFHTVALSSDNTTQAARVVTLASSYER